MREFVVTQENFHKEVEKAKKPVLLIFWKHDDILCLKQRIVASRLASVHDEFSVGSVCCNEEPYLANRFKIESEPGRDLPAIILMMRGSARCGKYRFMSVREIEKMISKYI